MNNRSILYFLSLVVFLQGIVFPQFSFNPEKFENISTEQGLSQSSVYCIHQDSRGFMWFGTADGLNRYDGYEFKIFRNDPFDSNSISNNIIRSIAENNERNLFVGTDKNLNKLLRKENKFIFEKNYFEQIDAKINFILTGKEEITIATGSGIRFLSPDMETKKIFNLSDDIISVFKDSYGDIWAGGSNGIYLFNRTIADFDLVYSLKYKSVQNINEDEKGNLYFVVQWEGLIKYNRADKNFTSVFEEKEVCSSYLQKDNNNLWIGTRSKGIFIFNTGEGRIVNHLNLPARNEKNSRSSMFQYKVASLLIDKSNILWVGTDGNGIYKYNLNEEKFWKFSDPENGSDIFEGEFIKSIYKDYRNFLWVGTLNSGLLIYDINNKVFRKQSSNVFKDKVIFSITESAPGTFLLATNDGLFITDQNRKILAHYFPIGDIQYVTADSNGNIWLSAAKDIYVINREIKKTDTLFISFSTEGYYPLQTFIFSSDGKMWLGYLNAGLVHFNPATKEKTIYRSDPGNPFSISNNNVRAIYDDEQNNCLWIGTENGLNKFDKNTGKFIHYFVKDGLPNGFIYAIIPDNAGSLWISTNKGLSKFTPANKPGSQFKNFGPEDGLQSYEFNTGAYFKDENGYLYFGGVNGLNYFHPDSIILNPVKPNAVIVGIKKFDLPFDTGGEISEIDKLDFDYEESVFSIRFAALEFTNPLKNLYAYRLLGFEDKWVHSGTRREARYTNLDPGEYVFEVIAANNDGVWSDYAAQLKIIIVPPFYKTLWFRIVFFVFIVITIAGSIRYGELRKIKQKIQKLEEKQALDKERIRISRDMHDEIGANLTRISLLSNIASSQPGEEQKSPVFEQITESVNETIEKLDEIVWTVNPSNDSLKNLTAYISEYASRFFEASNIVCRFNFPDTIPEINLSAEKRHNFFLTIKEALNNIQKYSCAKRVELTLTVENSSFFLTIKDDGKGFNPQTVPETSNGIRNMKDRINSVGGMFELKSEVGKGTEISLRILV